ncbi:MAG: HD domain-containing protein [Magnetospirillum sp.]|nr:HD domain-containing protein [Magnetospirillum sp.]
MAEESVTAGLAAYERKESRKVVVAAIDGSASHREQVGTALTSFYRVAAFEDGDLAVSELIRMPPCVILVDETAPPYGGARVIERLRKMPALAGVPIIYTTRNDRVTLAHDVRQMGADAFLIRPYRRSALIRSVSRLVNKSTEAKWERLAPESRECLRKTVDLYNGISDVIDKDEPISYGDVKRACEPLLAVVQTSTYKSMLAGVRDHDNYSYVHSMRVATFLSVFGHAIGLKDGDLMVLATGGLLHDLGKMQIAHEVLNKPGKLEPEELEIMRSHVIRTLDVLDGCPDLPKGVMTIAGQHHEKLDGTGYPCGLKGSQLNELARMASIVDVFSALTDRRVYKPPMPPEEALGIMTAGMGNHLDRDLLARFRDVLLSASSA